VRQDKPGRSCEIAKVADRNIVRIPRQMVQPDREGRTRGIRIFAAGADSRFRAATGRSPGGVRRERLFHDRP
jgi:hypothetical protein